MPRVHWILALSDSVPATQSSLKVTVPDSALALWIQDYCTLLTGAGAVLVALLGSCSPATPHRPGVDRVAFACSLL